MLNDDLALLREYAARNSEAPFAALVARHVNLVYSVALRQVRDPYLAEEITQAVFILLARKGHALGDEVILPAWLCHTARHVGSEALRTQRRRQQREQEAHMHSLLNESATEAWQDIAPLLDGAMDTLDRKDHNALVLRFFEGKNFQEVGHALGASEDTARMRVYRALEKLRKFFTKRGVTSTTEIIAGAITANSVQAAPLALAKSATALAIAKGASASRSTLTLIKGALKIMAWTKAKIAIVAGAGILLAAGTTTLALRIDHQPVHILGIPADWSVLAGDSAQWAWTDNAIHGHSTTGETILASNQKYGNVTVSAMVGTTNRGAEFGIRTQDANNGYQVVFTPDGTPWSAENGSNITLRKKMPGMKSSSHYSNGGGFPNRPKSPPQPRGRGSRFS